LSPKFFSPASSITIDGTITQKSPTAKPIKTIAIKRKIPPRVSVRRANPNPTAAQIAAPMAHLYPFMLSIKK